MPKISATTPQFEEQIKDLALTLWEENSAIKEKGTDPGIVFFEGATNPRGTGDFCEKNRNKHCKTQGSNGANQEVWG